MIKSMILDVNKIKFNSELYPRINTNWMAIYQYSEEMKAGAKFPDIVVGLINDEYYIIDGKHRFEAMKRKGEKHIQVQVDDTVTNFNELFLRAVQYNLGHGQKLSVRDKIHVASLLQKMNIEEIQIARILHFDINKLKSIMHNRIMVTKLGQPVILKKINENISQEKLDDGFEDVQESIKSGGQSQIVIINTLIKILKFNLIEESVIIKSKLMELHDQLDAYLK